MLVRRAPGWRGEAAGGASGPPHVETGDMNNIAEQLHQEREERQALELEVRGAGRGQQGTETLHNVTSVVHGSQWHMKKESAFMQEAVGILGKEVSCFGCFHKFVM